MEPTTTLYKLHYVRYTLHVTVMCTCSAYVAPTVYGTRTQLLIARTKTKVFEMVVLVESANEKKPIKQVTAFCSITRISNRKCGITLYSAAYRSGAYADGSPRPSGSASEDQKRLAFPILPIYLSDPHATGHRLTSREQK